MMLLTPITSCEARRRGAKAFTPSPWQRVYLAGSLTGSRRGLQGKGRTGHPRRPAGTAAKPQAGRLHSISQESPASESAEATPTIRDIWPPLLPNLPPASGSALRQRQGEGGRARLLCAPRRASRSLPAAPLGWKRSGGQASSSPSRRALASVPRLKSCCLLLAAVGGPWTSGGEGERWGSPAKAPPGSWHPHPLPPYRQVRPLQSPATQKSPPEASPPGHAMSPSWEARLGCGVEWSRGRKSIPCSIWLQSMFAELAKLLPGQ